MNETEIAIKNVNEKNDDEEKESAGNVKIGAVGCIYAYYICSWTLFKNSVRVFIQKEGGT